MPWGNRRRAMPPPEAALDLAEAMVEELEDYLLSEEILWPISPANRLLGLAPRLSLGGLLLALDAVSALEPDLAPAQATRALRLQRKWESQVNRWARALGRKAAREAKMRLDLWRAYLADLEDSPKGAEDYAHEVRQRVIAERLLDFVPDEEEARWLRSGLRGADVRLRAWFRAGPFVWEERLERVYPQSRYWFLYGLPVPPGRDA